MSQMIAIRKEESDESVVDDDDERSNKDTIVQGIFKKELLNFSQNFPRKTRRMETNSFLSAG